MSLVTVGKLILSNIYWVLIMCWDWCWEFCLCHLMLPWQPFYQRDAIISVHFLLMRKWRLRKGMSLESGRKFMVKCYWNCRISRITSNSGKTFGKRNLALEKELKFDLLCSRWIVRLSWVYGFFFILKILPFIHHWASLEKKKMKWKIILDAQETDPIVCCIFESLERDG